MTAVNGLTQDFGQGPDSNHVTLGVQPALCCRSKKSVVVCPKYMDVAVIQQSLFIKPDGGLGLGACWLTFGLNSPV